MCGRFTLHHSPAEIAKRFEVQEQLFDFPPRYNIAPNQPIAVVTRNAHGDDLKVLEGYRWGLVPSWAKDDSIGSKMINARSETLMEKPSFKTALKRRRCLIPADGFYEWKTEGKAKQPMHVRFRDSRIFAFAGLWDEWNGPGDAPLRTCTIITGQPNELLSTLHHRMAVILEPQHEDIWLDPDLPLDHALGLLGMFPDKELEAFPVGKRVGNVTCDDNSCIAPLEAEIQPGEEANQQLTLL
ncbi:MAG TPA: SOS response-associated peptidase [Abditibacterium sp.]|jgi:putative SOS response-associated peptidase YedK